MKEKLSDYLLDVSKLIFAGVVLSTILAIESYSKLIILITGILATTATAFLGLYISEEK